MALPFIYKETNEAEFWRYWEQFVASQNLPPAYLKSSLEYQLLCSVSVIADKSFVYLVNKKPVACAFLPIEKHDEEIAVSINGGYVDVPLSLDASIQKKVFSAIDTIAREQNVKKILFTISPLLEDSMYNFLLRYHYLDTSILSYVINLAVFDNLLSACRHGHKALIKKILKDKDFSIFLIDKNNPSYAIHEEYRVLHHKCAGRITRPKETFDLQFEQLKQGNAVLFGLKYEGKSVAYSYFEFNADKALYASSADDPEYDKLPLYHLILFRAMEYLKELGVRYVDTSQPSSPSTQFDYYPDVKQLNIALFKRGFGGDFKSNFRGIKYFSKGLFRDDMKRFIKGYEEQIPSN